MISAQLYRKSFMSPSLTDPLIKEDTVIRFYDADLGPKQITADPAVSYSVGPFAFNATPHGAMSGKQLVDLAGVVTLTISTASKALTQELAFELGALCMAMIPALKSEQCIVKSANVSVVKPDPDSTFFLASTVVNLSMGYPVWNVSQLDGTLREVQIKTRTL
jgi:hypothetical protein